MYKRQNLEQWKADWQTYRLQLNFASEQVAKYILLLATQQEPGNLPKVLDKWQQLQTSCLDALQRHIERGKLWKLDGEALDLASQELQSCQLACQLQELLLLVCRAL